MLIKIFFQLLCFFSDGSLVTDILRAEPGLDPFVTIINSPIAGHVAYTHNDLKRVYIDLSKFKDKPHSLNNVLKHELGHTKGGTHGDGSKVMNYHLSVSPDGQIIEDSFVL